MWLEVSWHFWTIVLLVLRSSDGPAAVAHTDADPTSSSTPALPSDVSTVRS